MDKTETQKKKERPTEIPRWLDDDKELIIVAPKTKSGATGRRQPKRLKLADFPDTTDGWRAWCQYQIARWGWLHDHPKATTTAGRLQMSIAKTRERLAALQAKQEALDGTEVPDSPTAPEAQPSGPSPKKRAIKGNPQA